MSAAINQHYTGFSKFTHQSWSVVGDNRPFLLQQVIMDTHESWQHLVEGNAEAGAGLSTMCVTVHTASKKLSVEEAEEVVNNGPEPGAGPAMDPKGEL